MMNHLKLFEEFSGPSIVAYLKTAFDEDTCQIDGTDSKFDVSYLGDIDIEDAKDNYDLGDLERDIDAGVDYEFVKAPNGSYKVKYSYSANHKEVPDWSYSSDEETDDVEVGDIEDFINETSDQLLTENYESVLSDLDSHVNRYNDGDEDDYEE